MALTFDNIISIIGQENEAKFKEAVTNLLIEALEESARQYWIVYPNELETSLQNFVDSCAKDAMKQVKAEMKDIFTASIKKSVEEYVKNISKNIDLGDPDE